MSLTEFTSGNDGTRPIQAGDTPDIQDDFGVSVPIAAQNRAKGDACQMKGGFLQQALVADILLPLSPVVPTESKDNSTGSPGDLEMRVIGAGQIIALLGSGIFFVGQYARVTGNGVITAIPEVANTTHRKYARYIGKEGAIFARASGTPFTETLSTGIVPDQNLADAEIGWFELVESAL